MTFPEKRLKKTIEHALQWAKKVYAFRCDLLSEAQKHAFHAALSQLQSLYASWPNGGKQPEGLVVALEALEAQTKACGGRFSRTHFWSDNAEVLWVAAFLAISIRTFFIQPFRIPTCSMFPSFSGMLTRIYDSKQPKPKAVFKPLRWLWTGAENYYYTAPCDGQVYIPLFNEREMVKFRSRIRYEIEYGREIGSLWFKHVLPKPYKVYLLWVDHQQVRIRVPFEFTDMEALLRKKFFPQFDSFSKALHTNDTSICYDPQRGYSVDTGVRVKKGDTFLHFDIFAGDMVFVDRLTYHFRRPTVGEAIVFRTRNIPLLNSDLYYIKRLAGVAGDYLHIQNGQLFRNGKPIEGSSAFANNNYRRGIYPGYRAQGALSTGESTHVQDRCFFVLGDNSPFSYDSRFWGEVPEKEVIGKAAFVAHPASWRWGVAEHDKANVKANPEDYVFQ